MTYTIDPKGLVKISLNDAIFIDAKKHMVLSDDPELIKSYSRNAIRANLCKDFEEFKAFSFEDTYKKYSSEELSGLVEKELKKDISESYSVEE